MTTKRYGYQLEGSAFLALSERAGLFDEMGLGKTVQAIDACDLIGAGRILVLCPAALAYNWQAEFERWQQHPRPVTVLVHGNVRPLPGPHVSITTYSKLAWARPGGLTAALRTHWDVVILDEAHFLKNPEARRTTAVYGAGCRGGADSLIHGAGRVWLLTGTPQPNWPSELWTHLRALWPDRIQGVREYHQFRDRYTITRRLPDRWNAVMTVGARNVAELKGRLDGLFLRRRQVDVLQDLPDIRYETVVLDDSETTTLENDGTISRASVKTAYRRIADVSDLDDPRLRASENAEAVSVVRRRIGMRKVPAMVDLLQMELADSTHKVGIFCIHLDVINALRDALRPFGVVSITGSDDAKARHQAVHSFQTDPKMRVFIGQMQAAGTGLTLTAADQCILGEQSWVPAENAQAVKRFHRIGQRNSVRVRILTLRNTLDDALGRKLAEKLRSKREIFDDSTAN